MRLLAPAAVAIACLFANQAGAAPLPTINQVYTAAHSGRLDEARGMVDKVLAEKPNSAKAHFVKAEICASQSDLACVRNELGTAKRLDAGLAFANPAAVGKLERIAAGQSPQEANTRPGQGGFPWGWLLIGLGVAALLAWIVAVANRRGAQNRGPTIYDQTPISPMSPGPGMGGMSPGYGSPIQPGGFGSSLGRSLATGAALGAGMVAGEALADSLLHRNTGPAGTPQWTPDANAAPDLGGNDFGIGGADSWDSGGGMDSLGSDGSDW